ncbi:MAG: DUF692 domain-containing protein [Cognaticolwellia sp.]
MFSLNNETAIKLPLIGVGLRHDHFDDALNYPANIDFIEVHAENFFAKGGASHAVLNEISQHYKISLHATSLGLGSAVPAPKQQLEQLSALVERYQPILLSDHACFSWAEVTGVKTHAGDLLPVPFNDESLDIMVRNVQRAQQYLGRAILVENLSAYIQLPGSTYNEAEFLVKLCQQSGCKLLVDLNNLIVNAVNQPLLDPQLKTPQKTDSIGTLTHAKQWLDKLPPELVGEIHLAGCTQVNAGEFMIDDHSQPVSDDVWHLYHYAVQKFGAVATLIEWDESLPDWHTLIAEAEKAKAIATTALSQTSTSHNSALITEIPNTLEVAKNEY